MLRMIGDERIVVKESNQGPRPLDCDEHSLIAQNLIICF